MNVIIKRWSKRTTPKLSVCAVQSVFALDKAAMTYQCFFEFDFKYDMASYVRLFLPELFLPSFIEKRGKV